jgi:hypothetical protein
MSFYWRSFLYNPDHSQIGKAPLPYVSNVRCAGRPHSLYRESRSMSTFASFTLGYGEIEGRTLP